MVSHLAGFQAGNRSPISGGSLRQQIERQIHVGRQPLQDVQLNGRVQGRKELARLGQRVQAAVVVAQPEMQLAHVLQVLRLAQPVFGAGKGGAGRLVGRQRLRAVAQLGEDDTQVHADGGGVLLHVQRLEMAFSHAVGIHRGGVLPHVLEADASILLQQGGEQGDGLRRQAVPRLRRGVQDIGGRGQRLLVASQVDQHVQQADIGAQGRGHLAGGLVLGTRAVDLCLRLLEVAGQCQGLGAQVDGARPQIGRQHGGQVNAQVKHLPRPAQVDVDELAPGLQQARQALCAPQIGPLKPAHAIGRRRLSQQRVDLVWCNRKVGSGGHGSRQFNGAQLDFALVAGGDQGVGAGRQSGDAEFAGGVAGG